MNKVIRKKNENYTIISNVFVRDRRLSLKAKGLMALIMSLPPDWDFSVRGLVATLKEGRDAIYTAIKELKEYRYCKVIPCRDERNRIAGNDYEFYEEPFEDEQDTLFPCTEKPHTENPYTENPDTEKQDTENPPQINKDINNNLKEEYKKKGFIKPTIEEIDVYLKEHDYTISAEQFYDHYESNGWMVGKTHMKDWKAAIRTWNRNTNKYGTQEQNSTFILKDNATDKFKDGFSW